MHKHQKFLQNYIGHHQAALNELHTATSADFLRLVEIASAALRSGKKIMLFGNGGSAAEAQHIAAELSIKYMYDRPALAGIALTTDTSAITAAGNDYGFDKIFARQIEAIGQPGDVAIGYSTSGKSPNILAAFQSARQRGIATVGFTGKNGGAMKDHCDVLIIAPSALTPHIQEMHTILGHAFCAAVEDELNAVPYAKSPWGV